MAQAMWARDTQRAWDLRLMAEELSREATERRCRIPCEGGVCTRDAGHDREAEFNEPTPHRCDVERDIKGVG